MHYYVWFSQIRLQFMIDNSPLGTNDYYDDVLVSTKIVYYTRPLTATVLLVYSSITMQNNY